jgi:hypothetical protein
VATNNEPIQIQVKDKRVQTMAKAINIFDDDNFSKGQGIFPDGPTRWESFRFTTFDFGTPGNDQAVLLGMGQPLNPDGSDNGEVRPVRWGCTTKDGKGDVELVNPVKGEKGTFKGIAISESNKHGKLFGLADFSIFREHLKNAAKLNPELLDMDEAGTDITVLDGLVTEVAKYTKPENKKQVAADDDKPKGSEKKAEPWQVVIISEILDPKTFGKGGAKKKAAPKEAEEEAPKKKSKKEVELSDDPEEIVEAYLNAELTEDKEGEAPLGVKVGVSAWALKKGKEGDVAREAQSLLKANWAALLKSKGWSIADGKLSKDE